MLEEIRQQPETLARTLSAELRRVERLKRLLEKNRPRLIVLVARGTSDNAALFGRYLLEITTGIPVSLAAPSIATLYNAPLDYRETLVVARLAIRRIDRHQHGPGTRAGKGALTLGITNESESSLASLAEHVFLGHAGTEKSVAATKTYTAQRMLAMYLLAYALGARSGIADLESHSRSRRQRPHPGIRHQRPQRTIPLHALCRVVGRGLNYANAFEFALKLMETCYVVAERFSSADFLHGPIALVEPNFPVFAFAPIGVTWPSIGETLRRLNTLQAEVVAIADAGNREVEAATTKIIRLPFRMKEILTPIPYVVPAQLFAACLARQKGLRSGPAAHFEQSDADSVAVTAPSGSPGALNCVPT